MWPIRRHRGKEVPTPTSGNAGPIPSDLPLTLYHYTNADGLQGIVKEGVLWATDILYLNDASEFDYFLRVLGETILSDTPFEKFAESFRRVGHSLLSATDVFVSCFCERPNLLSQWRGYAGGVGGYCIGFPAHRLWEKGIILRKAIYDREAQDETLGAVKESAIRQIVENHAVELADHLGDLDEYLPQQVELLAEFVAYALAEGMQHVIKHPDFVSEEEWRATGFVDPSGAAAVNYRTTSLGVTPFCTIDIKENGVPLIEEIWIGPNPHQELAEMAVRRLLRSCGLEEPDVVIRKSTTPLRIAAAGH
jgi:hypothetical protein